MPNWLENWITFDKAAQNLSISTAKENSTTDKRVAVVNVEWNGPSTEITEAQVNMKLKDRNVMCIWKPHLAPQEDMAIGDLVFRSPAMIFERENEMFALIPDLDHIDVNRRAPHVMDYVETKRGLYYGLAHYERSRHVYHRRIQQPFSVVNGQKLFRFYLVGWKTEGEWRNFKPVIHFLWDQFAKNRMIQSKNCSSSLIDSLNDLEIYAKHTYNWAFKNWEKVVWQNFELNQKKVGGCVFVVRGVQSPGLGQEDHWREKKSLWNQAWFSSLRSAYGYRLWGEHWNDTDMIRRSELAKNFALSAPQNNGLFPSVYWAGPDQCWENGGWGHSDRRPENHEQYAHLLDMSWTCYWMLKWYKDIDQDDKLLEYTRRYVNRLMEFQDDNGSFPAWVHEESGEPSPYLIQSPETSMHVWLLIQLYQMTADKKYLNSAELGIEFVINHVIPEGRWEDFETYWSCSRTWDGKKYGEKELRSGLYNQCNLSVYWTAEALKELYLVTRKNGYLKEGEKVLAELSLYQAIWEPRFLSLPVLGGFGVMTSDDEWNDARQSLFALTYFDYYKITGKEEYKYRSIWAMRASFYMMYCPQNPVVKKLYENRFPHFGERDYGFEMENAHHNSNTAVKTGEFTIFDWGNGSAAASLGEILLLKA